MPSRPRPEHLYLGRKEKNGCTHHSSREEDENAISSPPHVHHPSDGALARVDPQVINFLHAAAPKSKEPVIIAVIIIAILGIERLLRVGGIELGSEDGSVADVHAAAARSREQT
jgi:hypothetical protein